MNMIKPHLARGAHGRGRRALLYSHDTFGLGHLRRSRTIAQALAADDPDLSALIVTGSPVAGRFDFPDRVDHVRLPGVVKLPEGDYASHNLGVNIEETVALRSAIIAAVEHSFKPDLLIIDKEPWGFRNELVGTLAAASARGARIVLGVRDVLDEPAALCEEWKHKNALEAIEAYYDDLWIYGLPQICEPLAGLPLSTEARARISYTGYLRREPPDWPADISPPVPDAPYVVVTTGGGGDGEDLIDWALSAYESDPTLDLHGVLIYGPFMNSENRMDFERRASALGGRISTIGFDSRIERLMDNAAGVIAMGGYNTFCEILSLDKPAVIAPRIRPRLEQRIRTEAAEKLGLVRMLDQQSDASPAAMVAAIRGLANQAPPSAINVPGLLDGLTTITARARLVAPGALPHVAHG